MSVFEALLNDEKYEFSPYEYPYVALDEDGNRFMFVVRKIDVSQTMAKIDVIFPPCEDKIYILNLKTMEVTQHYITDNSFSKPSVLTYTFKFVEVKDFYKLL